MITNVSMVLFFLTFENPYRFVKRFGNKPQNVASGGAGVLMLTY